jgi:hypothetical protein
MKKGWGRPFEDPILLPDGRKLLTLKNATRRRIAANWFWMVSSVCRRSSPAIDRNLGIRSQVGTATNSLDLVEALRLPTIFAVKNTAGVFDIHKVGLSSHSPYFTSRMRGSEW